MGRFVCKVTTNLFRIVLHWIILDRQGPTLIQKKQLLAVSYPSSDTKNPGRAEFNPNSDWFAENQKIKKNLLKQKKLIDLCLTKPAIIC